MKTLAKPGLSLLLAALMLVGCSEAAAPSPPEPTPSPTAMQTPTSTPVPTPDLAAIGAMYLALVTPANAAGCEYNKVIGDQSATLAELKEASAILAPTVRTWTDGLRAISWPPEIQADAQDLIKELAGEEAAVLAAAGATSLQAFNTAFDDVSAANVRSVSAANLLRGDLGLPSVSGTCE